MCHAPSAVAGKQWSKEDWDGKVTEMLQEEPDVTSRERAAIVDYLAAHFKPGGPIYVNLAGAKDLAALLAIPVKDAETIAGWREHHPLRDAGELAAIAGLGSDALPRITANEARLDFSIEE
jgi:hypothetical protein